MKQTKSRSLVVLLNLLCFVFFGTFAVADENPGTEIADKSVQTKLTEIKYNIQTVYDLQKRGVIGQVVANEQVNHYLALAKNEIGKPVNGQSLQDYLNGVKTEEVKGKSIIDKIKGYNSFWDKMIFGAVVCIVVGLTSLFIIYIVPIIHSKIPRWCYEVLVYIACIACFVYAEKLQNGAAFVALLGCLGMIGGGVITHILHDDLLQEFYKKTKINPGTIASFVCTVVWGLVAIYYNSPMIGFLAVIALESFFGFSVIVTPLCYGFGFKDEDVMPRATLASLIVATFYVCHQIFQFPIPYVEIFTKGALFMGVFVYFIGLIIMASESYYKKQKYFMMQVITVISGVATIFVGSVFGIIQLCGIGTTFFAAYLVEKYLEICWSNKHWAWGTTGLGILVVLIGLFFKAHPQYFLLGI